MKIKYHFVNEAMDIEVDEIWGNLLVDLDRREYNNNQTETRRHVSINAMAYEGELFIDHTAGALAALEKANDIKALQKAIDSLLPQQRELLQRVFLKKERLADIAREQGVSKPALTSRMQKIYAQLKKSLGKGLNF